MDPLLASLAAAAVVFALTAVALGVKLSSARAELAAEKARPPVPAPPRTVESRREAFMLLWFPTLTVDDASRTVTAAAAGLPHCLRCVRALTLSAALPEEWTCAGCGEKRPGTAADFSVVDSVLRDTLKEFLTRHPGYRLAPHLSAPKSSS